MTARNQTIAFAFGHSNLLAPTALERRMGRLLRASAPPAGDTGAGGDSGASQAAGGSNGQGNNGQGGGTGGTPANNGGSNFDPNSFWQSPGSDGTGAPNQNGSGSDASNPSGSGTGGSGGNDNQQFGQQLGQQIQNFTPGPIVTPEILTQIAEGNVQGLNDAITNSHRVAMQQSLQMSVGIMQRLAGQMMDAMDRRINDSLTTRDNSQTLEQEIPIAKQPGMRPIVDAVFQQALTRSKGDRAAAITLTRQMMQAMHGNMQGDNTGLNIPPPSAGSQGDQTRSPLNWLESLTAASQ